MLKGSTFCLVVSKSIQKMILLQIKICDVSRFTQDRQKYTVEIQTKAESFQLGDQRNSDAESIPARLEVPC